MFSTWFQVISTLMFVERRTKPSSAARNMTLSLAEELQAAISAESSQSGYHHHHQQQQPACAVALDEVLRSVGGGIAQFLVDVAELGSPDQVDPVNKFRDVVCDLAYGCVVEHCGDECTKSCCGADQLLVPPSPPTTTTSASGHVDADVIGDDSDSSSTTLLSSGSDITVTSSCASRATSVSGASDTGCEDWTSHVETDISKKVSSVHRTTSLESSRKGC